jgi:16S rRNA (cytosine1402-N4)-methyltransferase
MRISKTLSVTAADILMTKSYEELKEIFIRNSEELLADPIAYAISRSRKTNPLKTVGDLVSVIESVAGKQESPVKRIFQALRVEVNHEFENIKKGLRGAINVLSDEGKIVVITFHSLEDRIVKQFVLKNRYCSMNKKAIVSKRDTSYEKTAKLRIIRKTNEN